MAGNGFNRLAKCAAAFTGKPLSFGIAAALIMVWLLTGPVFKFSDTWQLVVNTGTTIITFLMVFLIQNTQNRDTAALQIKLDELIRVTRRADERLLDLEELDEVTLERIRTKYAARADEARRERGEMTRAEHEARAAGAGG